MADNPVVTNRKTTFEANSNPDITVRATETASGEIQHIRLDLGSGASESVAVGSVPINDAGGSITVDGTIAISGTVAATQSGTWNVTNISGTVSLPTGAATSAKQDTIIGHIDGVETALGTLALESGGNLANAAASLSVMDDWDETDRCKVNLIAGQAGVQGASGTATALTQRVVLATDVALPAGANVIGALTANQSVNVSQVNGVTTSVGTGTVGTGAQRVMLGRGATSTTSSVAGSASSVTLLASNTSRIKTVINNDSTATLYVKEGATASASDYSYKLFQDDFAIVDDYNGLIAGIWASATGSARLTETV